ncbi:MAG TPA: hypothetical protein VFZ24_08575 [Longimicrobiales bacterium]
MREYDLFAVTAHGLDSVCAAELATLGIDGRRGTGGVAWRGTVRTMYRANLELRTASRIVARAGEFRARGFAELERHAARLPWRDVLRPGGSAVLRVTCRRSKLYHEGAVAERVARVLADTVGVTTLAGRALDDDVGSDANERRHDGRDGDGGQGEAHAQLIVVRFHRDVCTISMDSSGELLHRRGYRQAVAKAPLRETIAAAMLLESGWHGESPLIDPFCGSGTIAIEAALLARRIPPGLANPLFVPRPFAFQQWPHFDAEAWQDVVAQARAEVRDTRIAITASDRDGGAVAAARANAARAGVEHDIDFRRARLSELEPRSGFGHLVTNPPYGVRVGERRDLHALYTTLGRTVRERLPGWTVTLLSGDDALAGATGLPLEERLATRNGGIPVRLLSGRIAAGAHPAADAV